MKADREQHLLADCIEKFLSIYDSDGSVFEYRNINVKHAIERELYVKCANNSNFMQSFRDVVIFKKSNNVFYSDPPLDAFLAFLQGDEALSIQLAFPKRWATFLRKKIISVILSLRSILNNLQNKKFSKRYSSPCNLIMFVGIEKKHSKFIQPIVEKIGITKCLYVPLRKGNRYWKQCLDLHCNLEYPVIGICASSEINLKMAHPLYSHVSNAALCVDSYISLINRCKPKSIVFSEGASYEEDIISRVAKNFGVPTIRVQYGRAGVLHNGYRGMVYDKMLMWGEGFIERLKSFSPAPSYIVTGPHILDIEGGVVDDDVYRIRKIIGNRKLVTIITQPICATISDKDYKSLVRCAKYLLNKNNNYFILVRTHPADSSGHFSDLENVYPNNALVTNFDEFHILSVLKSSSYIIGFYSTMLSEAIAVGVLPIILPLSNSNEIFPAPENEGAAIKIMNIDELESEIDYALSDHVLELYSDAMNEFSEKYFYKMDGMSTKRICDEIKKYE